MDYFARMRAGSIRTGPRTLRAKIDMAAPNIWMRDPVLYASGTRSIIIRGIGGVIYRCMTFAHCLSDYIEGITHSICTLEFEVHPAFVRRCWRVLSLPPLPLPHQYEFARRLNLTIRS